MQNKSYKVIIEKDEDGIFVAEVPSLQGCYTQGDTLKEVVENIKDAIAICVKENCDLDDCADIQLEIVYL